MLIHKSLDVKEKKKKLMQKHFLREGGLKKKKCMVTCMSQYSMHGIHFSIVKDEFISVISFRIL